MEKHQKFYDLEEVGKCSAHSCARAGDKDIGSGEEERLRGTPLQNSTKKNRTFFGVFEYCMFPRLSAAINPEM
jgi:hypothetical protein